MNNAGKNMERKAWIAAISGFTMPGMGQIYNGELFKGLSFLVFFNATAVIGARLSLYLTGRHLIIGLTTTLVLALTIYAFSIVEAFRRAPRQESEYTLRSYNRWYFYIAVWIFGSVFITGLASNYIRKNVVQVYKIASESMEQEVLKGDRVIVDKTAYKRIPPGVGDIIVFVFPDNRNRVYIKRIAGLPGDRIKIEDGREYTIPHGTIYVLGDNRQKSVDSREFGPISLKDVLGKVRLVYYSYGKDGMRWNRIGLTFKRARLSL